MHSSLKNGFYIINFISLELYFFLIVSTYKLHERDVSDVLLNLFYAFFVV